MNYLTKKLNQFFKTKKPKVEHIDYSDLLDSYILKKKLLSFSIQEKSKRISEMSGVELEQFIKDIFAAKGINCKTTPASGDFGVDLIAHLNSKKIAIQCKRFKDMVGFSAVQEVYTGKDLYECNEAWVITNSTFSKQAEHASKKLKIKLINVCNIFDQIQLTN